MSERKPRRIYDSPFTQQARQSVEECPELAALEQVHQDQITDTVAMQLEDLWNRLSHEPVASGHYCGLAINLSDGTEGFILVEGEKSAEAEMKSRLAWFTDPLMIADLRQNQL